ncbi:hypothetical protein BDR03DRAFT_1005692 [Suillus americanus]|nr:hypothetical protein BDR03DRAFT_1005692 [Suillus americanus]
MYLVPCSGCETLSWIASRTQYGQPKLSDFSRDCAIACGKAFLHLYIERRSLDVRPVFLRATHDPEFALTSSSRLHDAHWPMWTRQNDPELSFICDLILEIVLDVGVSIPISLRNPKIPNTFLMWMSHPLLHCLSADQYARFWRRRALDVVERLLVSPLPPTNVLANCLMAAGLLLDQTVDPNQLTSTNKGSSIKTLLVSVLESMQQAIGIDIHLELRERSSVYALKLLQPLAAVVEVEQFRQVVYDLGMPDWGVRLCQSIVNTVLHHPELCRPEACDKAWVAARDALHFSVITAGSGDSGPTDDPITSLSGVVADSLSFGQGEDGILSEHSSMCGKQNLRYLHILFSWTQSELWSHHLYDGGHLEACLFIANNLRYFEIYPLTEHLALYIIAIMARLKGEHNNLIPNDLCGLLVHKAWAFVALRSLKPLELSECAIHEVLEPFAKFTIQLLKRDTELVDVTNEFKSRVMQTLYHLEQGSADNVVISLVKDIVSLVTT